MRQGLMVVNAFLKSAKFDGIYQTLREAAEACDVLMTVKTNAELACAACTGGFDATGYDFALFWDKDVQLAARLEQLGLRVFNSARAIALSDDKALTWLTLAKRGLPMPDTILAPKTYPAIGYPTLAFADEAAQRLGLPLVLKECFGSFGQQVYLLDSVEALARKLEALAGTPMLMQRLVRESYGRDARINVVGGRVIASILRESRNGDFRSNVTLGGGMTAYEPTEAEAALALEAAAALGLDFAGVDVLFGVDGPLLCEVNSNAHFRSTLACTGVNMALALMRHIVSVLEARA